MEDNFNLEIISPEKIIYSGKSKMATLPSYEGDMGILKDHISIISFLKPGIIKIFTKSSEEKYYLEDGIVEFKDNNLSILTSFIGKTTAVEKSKLNNLLLEADKEINNPEILLLDCSLEYGD